mmetsp:Transcript_37404/g.105570  ORF Transcript_37404/g.105570 Transcript_37404/m.105570 type:complete len:219 (+) Transcript_37404:2385-3041(+)
MGCPSCRPPLARAAPPPTRYSPSSGPSRRRTPPPSRAMSARRSRSRWVPCCGCLRRGSWWPPEGVASRSCRLSSGTMFCGPSAPRRAWPPWPPPWSAPPTCQRCRRWPRASCPSSPKCAGWSSPSSGSSPSWTSAARKPKRRQPRPRRRPRPPPLRPITPTTWSTTARRRALQLCLLRRRKAPPPPRRRTRRRGSPRRTCLSRSSCMRPSPPEASTRR